MTKHTGKWKGVMIHHTATSQKASVSDIRKIHTNKGWGDIGYHYLLKIGENDTVSIKVGRSDIYNGAHAGVDFYNKNYLGIAIIGNFSESTPSYALYKAIAGAIKHIMNKYGVSEILGHREVKATQCPGAYFDLKKVKELVKN